MKRVLILFVGAFTLFSCGVDEVGLEVSDNATPNSAISSQYSISEEEALANLYAFMGEGGDSRSSDNRVVSTVLPVKYGDLGTRAVDGIDCENLLYIANFENEEGYAILAGDSRIEDEVIAIIDEGSLEPELLNHLVEWENNGRTYYEEFPMTGPGLFTVPETGDELYLNPNTFSLYDEEMQDYYVGNLDLSDYTIVTRSVTNTNGDGNPSDESIMLNLCVSYAMGGIIDFDPNPRDDGDDGEYVTTYSDWETTSIVEPLLADFVDWHQGSPFNDLYPEKGRSSDQTSPKKSSAGCMPLAAAKILTYHEYPEYKIYDDVLISWWRLKEGFDSSVLARKSAAALLRWISTSCVSIRFSEGTFTLPKLMKWFLQSIDLDDVDVINYNFDTVKNMINNNSPMIICAIPDEGITSSHAWNIDGYKTKVRRKTVERYVNRELESTYTETERRDMVHCDLGWRGKCNGYYVSGMFQLASPDIDYDEGVSYNPNYNYDYDGYLKLITCKKP